MELCWWNQKNYVHDELFQLCALFSLPISTTHVLAQTNSLYRPAFPPVRHGSRDSSVKQCRQSDCSNNVPPLCPIGFKRTHCTNGRAQFVPTSIALRPPILYVWSEKVRDIKSTIRTKKMQSCNEPIHTEQIKKSCTLHCFVANSMGPQTDAGQDSNERRT